MLNNDGEADFSPFLYLFTLLLNLVVFDLCHQTSQTSGCSAGQETSNSTLISTFLLRTNSSVSTNTSCDRWIKSIETDNYKPQSAVHQTPDGVFLLRAAATDFTLKTSDCPDSEFPVRIVNTDRGCLWYKKDNKFKIPKGESSRHLSLKQQ